MREVGSMDLIEELTRKVRNQEQYHKIIQHWIKSCTLCFKQAVPMNQKLCEKRACNSIHGPARSPRWLKRSGLLEQELPKHRKNP